MATTSQFNAVHRAEIILAARNEARAAFTEFKRDLDQTGQKLRDTERSTASLGGAMNAFKGTLGALGVTFGASQIFSFFKDSVEAANESEQANIRLSATLKSLGIDYGAVSGRLEEFFKHIQATTLFTDEQASDAFSRLADILRGDLNTAVAALPVVLDLATDKGIDLETAASAVGLALEGETTQLQRLNPNLKLLDENLLKGKSSAEVLAIIMGNLGAATGAAERAAAGSAGAMNSMTDAMDDLHEAVGGLVNDAGLPKLIRMLADVVRLGTAAATMDFEKLGNAAEFQTRITSARKTIGEAQFEIVGRRRGMLGTGGTLAEQEPNEAVRSTLTEVLSPGGNLPTFLRGLGDVGEIRQAQARLRSTLPHIRSEIVREQVETIVEEMQGLVEKLPVPLEERMKGINAFIDKQLGGGDSAGLPSGMTGGRGGKGGGGKAEAQKSFIESLTGFRDRAEVEKTVSDIFKFAGPDEQVALFNRKVVEPLSQLSRESKEKFLGSFLPKFEEIADKVRMDEIRKGREKALIDLGKDRAAAADKEEQARKQKNEKELKDLENVLEAERDLRRDNILEISKLQAKLPAAERGREIEFLKSEVERLFEVRQARFLSRQEAEAELKTLTVKRALNEGITKSDRETLTATVENIRETTEKRKGAQEILAADDDRMHFRLRTNTATTAEAVESGFRMAFGRPLSNMERLADASGKLAQSMQSSFSDGFFNLFNADTDNMRSVWENALLDMRNILQRTVSDMIAEIFRLKVVQPLISGLFNFAGITTPGTGGVGQPLTPPPPALHSSSFAWGGRVGSALENVPSFGTGGVVPAFLHSGEFVVRRSSVTPDTLSDLAEINRSGQSPKEMRETVVNVVIDPSVLYRAGLAQNRDLTTTVFMGEILENGYARAVVKHR